MQREADPPGKAALGRNPPQMEAEHVPRISHRDGKFWERGPGGRLRLPAAEPVCGVTVRVARLWCCDTERAQPALLLRCTHN